MIGITIDNLPEITVDFTREFKLVADYLGERVKKTLAEGGNPPWQRTTVNTIPRLYDRFASTIRKESDEVSATVSIGEGRPDTWAHQYGAEFMETVTEKQRTFFWMMFYKSGDEKWKWMAVSKTLLIKIPERSLIDFQDEDIELITEFFGERVLKYKNAKEATFG